MADAGAGTTFLGCEVRGVEGAAGGAAGGALREGAEPEAARGTLGAARENAAFKAGREGLARLASTIATGTSIAGFTAGAVTADGVNTGVVEGAATCSAASTRTRRGKQRRTRPGWPRL
jgi:hypothetical protein